MLHHDIPGELSLTGHVIYNIPTYLLTYNNIPLQQYRQLS